MPYRPQAIRKNSVAEILMSRPKLDVLVKGRSIQGKVARTETGGRVIHSGNEVNTKPGGGRFLPEEEG